jgi:hypothetical protein
MAVDKRLEVEIALRDSASLALKAIADQLDNINKALAKGGEGKANEGADAFRKIKESTEGIRKTSEEGAKGATEAAERMLPLAATLLRGAAARATLFAVVAKFAIDTMTEAARERQEWAAMATDTGLQEGFISMLAQAQRKLGIEQPQALANIKNIMGGLGDMAYGRGSQVSTALGQMGEGTFATQLENLMMAGKGEEGIRAAIARYDQIVKVSEVDALKFAAAMRVPPSFFKGLSEELKTVQPAFELTLKDANRWVKDWTDVYMWGTNAIKFMENAGTIASNRTFDVIKTITDYGYLKGWLSGGGKIPEDQLEAFKERNKETLALLQDILAIFQKAQNKESIEKREAGGTVLAGREYLVGEKGPEIFRSNAGWMQMLEPPGTNRGRLRGGRFQAPTGGDILPHGLAPPGSGSGGGFPHGLAPPGSEGDLPVRPGTEESLSKLFGDLEDRARFNQRFGEWPGYRFNSLGVYGEHPRAGKTPEETWEALNKGLSSDWGWGVGIPEGKTPRDDDLGREAPTAGDLRALQREMEMKSLQWPGRIEDQGLGQRGGTPGEFYNPRTGLPQGQPINFQRMMDDGGTELIRDTMDSELGGGSGSLGAQIEFRNVPEGVTTEADADGFDSFTVNKTRQLEGA